VNKILFVPANAGDIEPGVVLRVISKRGKTRHEVTGQCARSFMQYGDRKFTLEGDALKIYNSNTEYTDYEVEVLVDRDTRIKTFMRKLRARAAAVPPLGEPVFLKGGPLGGHHYRPRSHDSTLEIQCLGRQGRYVRDSSSEYVWEGE